MLRRAQLVAAAAFQRVQDDIALRAGQRKLQRFPGGGAEFSLSLSLSLCPSHIASSIDKIINKSSMLQIEKFSEKYLLDNEWIIIFQFE